MTDTANIKKQFLNSLKRGTGEAYLIIKNNPKIDFSNQKDKIRKAVLRGLATEQNDTWNLTHLFALTKLFAQQNDAEAKQAIYDRFLNNPIEGSDWVGAYEILELDELNGLLYVADKFGKYIEQNPDDWQDDWIIKRFQEENKNIKVSEELKKKAKTNKCIRIYLDNIKRTKASQEKHKTKPTKYKDIIDEVLNSKPCFSYFRKRNLTDDEVNQIAIRLINETDKSNIERLLAIFDFYKFPYDSQIILDFAKQKRTNKNKIAENAINALQYLKSKDIRNFAMDKIQNAKNPIDYLEILVSNYKSGDFKLLSEIANKTNNEYKIERLAEIFTNIFKANKTKECKQPLEILYSKMNCAIHREGIIEILSENNVLADKIRKEIEFDSYLDTRELIKQ